MIDQKWAVIAHLDILSALDGEAKCRLVLVDLAAGRAAGALCVAAREWERRVDIFSIPTDDLCVSVPVEPAAGGTSAGRSDGSHPSNESTTERSTRPKPPPTIAAPTPPVVEQPAEEASTPASSANLAEHGDGPQAVAAADAQRTGGAAAPSVMADDEIRAEYRALDDDAKREVARLRDEHIAVEARAGRCVSKRDATALALKWTAPFEPKLSRATCRSCNAPIYWVTTQKGHAMPVDVEPTASGNLLLQDGIACVHEPGDGVDFDQLYYVSHFATCPNADSHRRRDTLPSQPAAPPALLPERAVRFTGDEGDTLPEAEALEARGWMESLMNDDAEAFAAVRLVAKQADDANVGFHILVKPSRRRWEIYRGLANVARYAWSDELVRDLLAAVTGDDACRQPAVALGQIVGLLDVTQAAAFADLAARLRAGSVTAVVDPDTHQLTFPALALAGA